jgi:FtsZ-binding cell division protein ZapB
MQTIQLHIPDTLANKITRITENTETFIINLLKSKVNELEKNNELTNEYKLAAKENKKLRTDFKHVDLEGWEDAY